MDGISQTKDIILESCATSCDHHVYAHMLSQRLSDLGRLQCEFSCRCQKKSLDFWFRDVHMLETGDDECTGFTCAILSAREDIATSKGNGDSDFLDGRWILKSGLEYPHVMFAAKIHLLQFQSEGLVDIL